MTSLLADFYRIKAQADRLRQMDCAAAAEDLIRSNAGFFMEIIEELRKLSNVTIDVVDELTKGLEAEYDDETGNPVAAEKLVGTVKVTVEAEKTGSYLDMLPLAPPKPERDTYTKADIDSLEEDIGNRLDGRIEMLKHEEREWRNELLNFLTDNMAFSKKRRTRLEDLRKRFT